MDTGLLYVLIMSTAGHLHIIILILEFLRKALTQLATLYKDGLRDHPQTDTWILDNGQTTCLVQAKRTINNTVGDN